MAGKRLTMPPDTEDVAQLVELADAYSFYPPLADQLQRAAALMNEMYAALPELQRSLPQACPTCGAQPDQYCISATGKIHGWQYGVPYIHVARKPLAPVVQLRGAS